MKGFVRDSVAIGILGWMGYTASGGDPVVLKMTLAPIAGIGAVSRVDIIYEWVKDRKWDEWSANIYKSPA